MFLGLFLIIAGGLTLLESFGLINVDVSWGAPLAIVCFGFSLIYDAIKRNKKL